MCMKNTLGIPILGHGRDKMYKYDKKLPYPVNIKKKDLKMAKYIITAYGGPNAKSYTMRGNYEMQIYKTKSK